MNILHDSECPKCGMQATLELTVDAASHNPQLLDIIVKCHNCGETHNQFISINEMDVCHE